MNSITQKAVVKTELNTCLQRFAENDPDDFIIELNHRLLQVKVKFPLLEYCADIIYQTLPAHHHLHLCDKIESLKTEGGNVLIGILLQKRLDDHLQESMIKAAQYLANADIWYVSDIIGERVFGWGLLHHFSETYPILHEFRNHSSNWVVRAIGAGSHYAIKKGLCDRETEKMFALLLTLAKAKDYHIKTGIGWAAKTAARFHPEVVAKYNDVLKDGTKTGHWFRNKVSIGLERNIYAQRN